MSSIQKEILITMGNVLKKTCAKLEIRKSLYLMRKITTFFVIKDLNFEAIVIVCFIYLKQAVVPSVAWDFLFDKHLPNLT
jgi:hypothetical protein